ncbi:MAG: hypothetical protein MJB12_10105 [Firmicutes bacterium]|nr:hypothetical protein [Bacillota bacterium]
MGGSFSTLISQHLTFNYFSALEYQLLESFSSAGIYTPWNTYCLDSFQLKYNGLVWQKSLQKSKAFPLTI